jgi:hypothetical protein
MIHQGHEPSFEEITGKFKMSTSARAHT